MLPIRPRHSGIDFETQRLAGADGEKWTWTPDAAFVSAGAKKFVVEELNGWTDLRARTVNHPAELLRYGAIAHQLDKLLGADRSEYDSIIQGTGSGEFEGDTYIGTSCAPHLCTVLEAILVADIHLKRVFVAWKTADDSSIKVRPPVSEWPTVAKLALAKWSKTWN